VTTGAVSGGPTEFGRTPRPPRPTSRRARAATRRRAAGAVPAATAGSVADAADSRHPGDRPLRRSPSGANIRRRRTVLLVGIGALTVVGVALAVGGLSEVRNSTVGRYQQALGPSEPGYQASVVPTPTMGVLLRSADGRLAGAAVLALEPGDGGGSVSLVPAAVVVTDATDAEQTLDAVYADQGAEAASQALANVVTVAVNESVVIDEAAWTRFAEPVGPVTVHVDEAVGEWPAGDVVLQPEDVGRFLAARAAGEPDLARVERQQAFWTAWLPLVRDAGEGGLPGEVDTGIGRFLRIIAAGDGVAEVIPVGREDTADGVRYRVDAGRLGQFVSLTIPYPTSPSPGVRIRTRLLNGTDDPDLTERAARILVASGAEIAIVGNAGTLDEPETRIVHPRGSREDLARWLQGSLGVGRLEPLGSGQPGAAGDDIDDDIDVTVILGQDAGDTLGREQTSD
jgi:LytR_cpsA_psr family/LytR cell envelope-related transcriptional attenuator